MFIVDYGKWENKMHSFTDKDGNLIQFCADAWLEDPRKYDGPIEYEITEFLVNGELSLNADLIIDANESTIYDLLADNFNPSDVYASMADDAMDAMKDEGL